MDDSLAGAVRVRISFESFNSVFSQEVVVMDGASDSRRERERRDRPNGVSQRRNFQSRGRRSEHNHVDDFGALYHLIR